MSKNAKMLGFRDERVNPLKLQVQIWDMHCSCSPPEVHRPGFVLTGAAGHHRSRGRGGEEPDPARGRRLTAGRRPWRRGAALPRSSPARGEAAAGEGVLRRSGAGHRRWRRGGAGAAGSTRGRRGSFGPGGPAMGPAGPGGGGWIRTCPAGQKNVRRRERWVVLGFRP